MKDKLGNELNEFGFRKDFDWKTRFDLKTEVDDYVVSTVDLGLNYNFGKGDPLYYETMVFAKENNKINFMDLYCERYTTEEEAKKGHEKIVEALKKGDFFEKE